MVDPALFKPGIPIIVETRDGVKGKFTSYFRGLRPKQYLIIDNPALKGKLVPVTENGNCIIRFIHEGQIIGFRSRIVAAVRQPVSLVFLTYPQDIETTKLRKSERFNVSIESVCAGRRLDGLIDAYPRSIITNLSTGGCGVESFESFEKGLTVFLTAFLPDRDQVNDIECEVKRCEAKDGKFLLGLEFADMLDPAYEEMRGFVHTLEAFQGRA